MSNVTKAFVLYLFRMLEGEGEPLLQAMIGCLEGTSNDAKGSILSTFIDEIPREDWADVIGKAKPFFSQGLATETARTNFLRAVASLPAEERVSSLLARILPLVEDEEIFLKIRDLPAKERSEVFQRVCSVSEQEVGQIEEISALIEVFFAVPKAKREEVMQLLLQNPEFIQEDLLFNLLLEDPELRQASSSYLLEGLNAAAADLQEGRLWAYFIWNYREAFSLYEEDPLIQRALEVICISDPEVLSEPKNPYRVARDLACIVKQEPLWDETSSGAFQVAIHLAKWRELAQERAWTVGDLPPGVSANGFSLLFQHLEDRLEEQEIEEIEQEYGMS